MERETYLKNRIITAILIVMYIVGVIGHSIDITYNLMIALTPFTLLFTGGLVIYGSLQKDSELIKWMIITYIVTFCFEVFGVQTGLIFGNYIYGNILGPTILDTPLIIGFNWVLVILGSAMIARRFIKNSFIVVLTAPLLTVLFDLFLEPVAIKLGYWQWYNSEIPLQNYLAWYAVSLLAVFYYVILNIEVKSDLPIKYFAVQLIFFLILNITL